MSTSFHVAPYHETRDQYTTQLSGNEHKELQRAARQKISDEMAKEAAARSLKATMGTFDIHMHMTQHTVKLQEYFDSLVEPLREGVLARIECSKEFELLSCIVILSNAICTAVATDWEMRHMGDALPGFVQILEYSFLTFYVMELCLRLQVHKLYFFINHDAKWNMFDFALVLIALGDLCVTVLLSVEAGNNVTFMRAVRLIKITKILRTFRVLKIFEDLAQMLLGFARSMISLFWCFVMLFFILYMFGLVLLEGMAQFLAEASEALDTEARSEAISAFGSLFDTMLTLYIAATGGNDWKVYYDIVKQAGSVYGIVFLFFTFFFTFAVFNILTGIFVEKAMSSAQPERDQMILDQRKQLIKDTQHLKILIGELKKNGDEKMTSDEFLSFLKNDDIVALFSSVGLHLNDAKMFFKMLATMEGSDEVSVNTFIEGCLAMRGAATSLDMQRQLYEVQFMFAFVRRFEQNCMNRFDELTYKLRDEFQEAAGFHHEVSLKLDAGNKERVSTEYALDEKHTNISNRLNSWITEADQRQAKLEEIWSHVRKELHTEADRQRANLEEIWNFVKQEMHMIQLSLTYPQYMAMPSSGETTSYVNNAGLDQAMPVLPDAAFYEREPPSFGLDQQSDLSNIEHSRVSSQERLIQVQSARGNAFHDNRSSEQSAFDALQMSFSRTCYTLKGEPITDFEV